MVDDGQAVGHLHGLLLVVGHQHRGDGQGGVQVAQPQAELGAHLGVERAEGLVEQQHLGLNGQRPGQGHALALAARELRRVALAEVGQAHQLEQLVDAGLDLGLGAVADLEPEGHVAPHGEVAERRVVLEAEPDAAAARRRVGQVLALNADDAAVGRVEAGDDAQQRRLATAARAEERRQRPAWAPRATRRRAPRRRRSASRWTRPRCSRRRLAVPGVAVAVGQRQEAEDDERGQAEDDRADVGGLRLEVVDALAR